MIPVDDALQRSRARTRFERATNLLQIVRETIHRVPSSRNPRSSRGSSSEIARTMGGPLCIVLAMLQLQACGKDAPQPSVQTDRASSAETQSSEDSEAAALAANCAGFSKEDAATILGVAPATLTEHSRDETEELRLCSYAQDAAPFARASFYVSVRESVDAATQSMASEREMMVGANEAIARTMNEAAEAQPADPLQGVGDEAFWSPLNGALMMRVDRVIVQITQPEQRDRQRELALQIAAKLRGSRPVAKIVAGEAQFASVPLVPGLTIVTAIHIDGVCDCESVKQIMTADAEAVRVSYAADIPFDDVEDLSGSTAEKSPVRQVRAERVMLRRDLEHAREYMHLFGKGIPLKIPGATALGVSGAVLADLKKRGEARLSMSEGAIGTSLAGLIGAFAGSEFAGMKEIGDLAALDKVSGTIRRAEADPVLLDVLVNGEMQKLRAVHARGSLGDLEGEFYILDNPANPLALKFKLGEDRLQVVKIDYPLAQHSSMEAASLACALSSEARRAEIHGIHFDFASADIRPQSELVLQAIVMALREQPQWEIQIEGHTDKIGGGAYNARLSEARANAVKQSLMDDGIPAERLKTAGFGADRPKASNDTLEGRARNRRVELVRTDSSRGQSSCEPA